MNSRNRSLGFLGMSLVSLVSFAWGCAEGAPEQAQADVPAQSSDMDAMKAMLESWAACQWRWPGW